MHVQEKTAFCSSHTRKRKKTKRNSGSANGSLHQQSSRWCNKGLLKKKKKYWGVHPLSVFDAKKDFCLIDFWLWRAIMSFGSVFRDTHPNWLANTCPINFSFFVTWQHKKIGDPNAKKEEVTQNELRRNAFGRNKDRRFSVMRNSVQNESDDSCQIGGNKRSGRSKKRKKGMKKKKDNKKAVLLFCCSFALCVCTTNTVFSVCLYLFDRCAITRISALSAVDCGAVDHNGCYG